LAILREITDQIVARLKPAIEEIAAEYRLSGRIATCQVEDLLMSDIARAICQRFSRSDQMMLEVFDAGR
jgi:hypothetical protein